MATDLSSTHSVRLSKARLLSLGILIGAILALYSINLFTLQIVKGYEYRNMARQVALRTMKIPAQRGEIFDRHYDTPLVTNIDSFAVDIIPAEVPEGELSEILSRLAPLLRVSPEELIEKIPARHEHIYQPLELKSGISFETISSIAENIEQFPGITWHNKPIRNYLMTGSIAHTIGYVGDITREEIQILYNRGYDFGSVLGKNGIEKQYDMILRGSDGTQFRTVDVKGRRVDETHDEEPPTLGRDIVLTLDRRIQTVAERALGKRNGSVVVLKPSTGEVLAMVSYPWFDPNTFYSENGNENFRSITSDTTFPFLNRAIQSHYAPASTFKTIMMAAILEEEVFPPDKTINCTGKIEYGDRVFNCHKKTGHGRLDLNGALAESCDVYFWTVGTEYLGIENIMKYASLFGFGAPTGIDLPGEVAGILPGPQWKQRVYNSPWLGGDTMNISIGQGYLTSTTLQVANSIAMVVNDGVAYRPYLLKEIRDSVSGEVLDVVEPQVLLNAQQISRETFAQVREGLRNVVTNGTANVVITTKATHVAGKTGTGEVGYIDQWNSWFAAYAPYDTADPEQQIVVVVMVEATNEWEWWAPKAANIIFQAAFANQDYTEAVNTLGAWYMR